MPRHDLDAISLMAGVLFGGVAIMALADLPVGDSTRWLWPVLLIVVGSVGLLATALRQRRQGGPWVGDGHERDERERGAP